MTLVGFFVEFVVIKLLNKNLHTMFSHIDLFVLL